MPWQVLRIGGLLFSPRCTWNQPSKETLFWGGYCSRWFVPRRLVSVSVRRKQKRFLVEFLLEPGSFLSFVGLVITYCCHYLHSSTWETLLSENRTNLHLLTSRNCWQTSDILLGASPVPMQGTTSQGKPALFHISCWASLFEFQWLHDLLFPCLLTFSATEKKNIRNIYLLRRPWGADLDKRINNMYMQQHILTSCQDNKSKLEFVQVHQSWLTKTISFFFFPFSFRKLNFYPRPLSDAPDARNTWNTQFHISSDVQLATLHSTNCSPRNSRLRFYTTVHYTASTPSLSVCLWALKLELRQHARSAAIYLLGPSH